MSTLDELGLPRRRFRPRCSGATFGEDHGDADDDGSDSEDADDGCPEQRHEHRGEEQQQQGHREYLERRPVPLAEPVRHYGVSSGSSAFTMAASRGYSQSDVTSDAE